MSKDYYKILEVDKNATKEEIKKAYKNLAKKYHPDISKEDDATEKFKEVNEAAAVLGDDEKRSQYDQFGDADSFKKASGFGGFDSSNFGFDFNDLGAGFGFEDIFDQFFGGGSGFSSGRSRRGSTRGSDLRYDLDIELEDAYFGAEKTINVPRLERCDKCEGSGAKEGSDIIDCPNCNGAGILRKTQRTPFGVFQTQTTCSKCKGEGKTIKEECPDCDGRGVVKKTKKITIKIPKGTEEGTNLRVQGMGEAGENGAPEGDLYLILHVKEHKTFQRRQDDIFVEVEVPFTKAALGDEIEVPTLDGKAKLKIPAGTQPRTVFRMKNKGIPFLHGSGQGNENVIVNIKIPTKLSKKQKKLLEDFDKSSKKGLFN